MEILQFLRGLKWGEIPLAYVHAVRPSSIRVTKGEVTCDSRKWRVTIEVDKNDIIREITQEVEVILPENIQHGYHLQNELNRLQKSIELRSGME